MYIYMGENQNVPPVDVLAPMHPMNGKVTRGKTKK